MLTAGRIIPCKYNFPKQHEIDLKKEELGYDFYCPESLLKDLIYLYVYKMKNRPVVYNSIILKIDRDIINFLKAIPTEIFLSGSALERAISTLLYYVDKVDFRALENGNWFKIDRANPNYRVSPSTINKYNINEEDQLTDISDILELSELLVPFVTHNLEDSKENIWSPITNYSEILKSKYSSLVRPDFYHRLLNKTLPIFSHKKSYTTKKLIFVEDVSSSLEKYNRKIKAVYYALSLINEDIEYFQIHGNIDYIGKVKGDYFLTHEITRYTVNFDINHVINELENLYELENCTFIFVTDQSHFVSKFLKPKKIWNFIFLDSINSKLDNLSKGKSIVI